MVRDTEKKSALIIIVLSSFLNPYMSTAINIALPTIGKEFNLNAVLLSWIATSFLLSASMFLLPFGRLADILGRKKIFLLGLIIYTISSFLCAVSYSFTMLLIGRIIQGIGEAMVYCTTVAILTSVFPAGERGKVLGINVAAVYTGLSAGPFLGGIITSILGWRSIFLLSVLVGFLIIILVLLKLKDEWAEAKEDKFDMTGSIIYAVTLPVLLYGFSRISTLEGFCIFLIGIFGFIYLLFKENKSKNYSLKKNLFRQNKVFLFSNLAYLIRYTSTFSIGFILSLYLQSVKGLSPQTAGIVLVSQPIVHAALSPISGRLSDRIEPRITTSIGLGLAFICLLFLAFINEDTSVVHIVFILVLLGFAFALFSAPNTNAIMSSVDKRFYGVASGTLGTVRLTGQICSMGIAMLIFSFFTLEAKITLVNYLIFLKAIRVGFIIYAIICFAGIFISFARGKLR